MSGKSTYIRQTALLVIMAQMGSYIPAQEAHIGLVDKIFTRIGAHDDIAKGQSTFMVEMNETADILNNLTERSLLILDEIGRGTSTYDGLSLAWALAEYLQKTKARTLFATHFHELTALADEYPGVKNYNVAVTSTAAITGMMIPPSNIMIVYALVSGGVSISAMFMAGILPGILFGLFLMIVNGIVSKKRNYGAGKKAGLKEILKSFKDAFLSLLLIVIVLGGILKGIFTATEAAFRSFFTWTCFVNNHSSFAYIFAV